MTVDMKSDLASPPATLPRVTSSRLERIEHAAAAEALQEEELGDWKKRGEAHLKRAAEVAQAAKRAAAEMAERAENVKIRKAEKLAREMEQLANHSVGSGRASSATRRKSSHPFQTGAHPTTTTEEAPTALEERRVNEPNEPRTKEEEVAASQRIVAALAEAKRRCSMDPTARRGSMLDATRQERRSSIFEEAEKALSRRLEETARRASIQNAVFQKLTDVVQDAMATRRMSSTAKRLSILQVPGEENGTRLPPRHGERSPYRLSIPNHKLYNEYLRQTQRGPDESNEGTPAVASPTTSVQADGPCASPTLTVQPEPTLGGTCTSLDATADANWADTFQQMKPEEQQALMVEEAADFLSEVLHRTHGESSFHKEQDMSPASVAIKMDSRIKRMRTIEAKHVVCQELHEQIEARAVAQISTGRAVENASTPPRLSRHDLERFLSPETIRALKIETNSRRPGDNLLSDFLLLHNSQEEEDFFHQPAVWSSLPALKKVVDWTKLTPSELSTSLEVSVAVLKLQRFVRQSLARGEFHRRQRAVRRNVMIHQRWADAGILIVRSMQQYMAQRRVEAMQKRIRHLNEQRIELEMSRIPPAAASALNSPYDAEITGLTRAPSDGTFLLDPSRNAFAWRTKSPTKPMENSKRRSVGPSARSKSAASSTNSSGDSEKAFHNPFPLFHPHHDDLHNIQKRVAARIILITVREYMLQTMEDLQNTAHTALMHLVTGKHPMAQPMITTNSSEDGSYSGGKPPNSEVLDCLSVNSSLYHDDAAPFSSNKTTSMLTKYSGNVLERMDRRRQGYREEGDDDDEERVYVELKRVKLSELEAAKVAAAAEAKAKQKKEWERVRRAQELERISQQIRLASLQLIQRCGRGLRKRLFLFGVMDQIHSQQAANPGVANDYRVIRAERFSLSLSNSLGTPTKQGEREDQAIPFQSDREIIRLISLRNPDLLPERARALAQDRQERVVQLQAALRGLASCLVARHRLLHRHAVRIQRAWRRVWTAKQECLEMEKICRFRFAVVLAPGTSSRYLL